MATLKMDVGILGSQEDELEAEMEAALLPAEWRVTIIRRTWSELTVSIEMQNGTTTRTFPPRSTNEIVEFLQRVGREFGRP